MPSRRVPKLATQEIKNPWIYPLLILIQKTIKQASSMRKDNGIPHREDCECNLCRCLEYLQQANCQANRIEVSSKEITKRG